MAKIPFGILGPFIGKVGPVIGYIRGETWCVRSMPSHYRDARTEAQLRNRDKMTRLMQFLCSMKPVIRSSFDVWNSDNPCRTEFNMAFAENFRTALRTTAHGTDILYHKVKLADGLLPTLTGANAYQEGHEVHISWSAISSTVAMVRSKAAPSPADRLCLCAHNPATGQSVWSFGSAVRGECHATFALPDSWQESPIHLWAWLSSNISTSPSVYLGEYGQPQHNKETVACSISHAAQSTISSYQSATKAVPPSSLLHPQNHPNYTFKAAQYPPSPPKVPIGKGCQPPFCEAAMQN